MISPKTKAIVYPHLFGKVTDIALLETLCKDAGIVFIEDGAQSLGASYRSRKAGSFGQCSCVSFDPTKVVSAPGSGGVLLTDDAGVYDRVKQLRYHGKSEGKFISLGYNSQMPSLTAALLDFKLSMMHEWAEKRISIASRYTDALAKYDIVCEVGTDAMHHIFHKYVIRFASQSMRDAMQQELQKQGIAVRIHYAEPLQQHALFDAYDIKKDACTVTNEVCRTVLSLPIHPWLTDKEVARVVHSFCQAYEKIS